MGALLVFMTHDIDSWLQANAVLRVKNLGLIILFGVILYLFTTMLTGVKKHHLLRGAK
jgi:hypothetical protein